MLYPTSFSSEVKIGIQYRLLNKSCLLIVILFDPKTLGCILSVIPTLGLSTFIFNIPLFNVVSSCLEIVTLLTPHKLCLTHKVKITTSGFALVLYTPIIKSSTDMQYLHCTGAKWKRKQHQCESCKIWHRSSDIVGHYFVWLC